MTKILAGLKAQINVSNLAKLRTRVQSNYFHTEETAVEQFVEYGLETFRLRLYVLPLVQRKLGLINPLQSTSSTCWTDNYKQNFLLR